MTIGELLRGWRTRRRLSQLDLALDAEISTRHLSFIETGRAQPSREMVLHLAAHLEVPLREQNLLLTAAGFAANFTERHLDDAGLTAARQTIEIILRGHEPYPALALDRWWNIVLANKAAEMLLSDIAPALLAVPVNVLRLSLDPHGLAKKIINLSEWRAHLFERLHRQIEKTADEQLIALEKELKTFSVSSEKELPKKSEAIKIAVPLQLKIAGSELSLLSTTTVFGTPADILLSEITIESFFPADEKSAEIMRNVFTKN